MPPSVIPLSEKDTQLNVLSLLLAAMAFLSARYATDLDDYKEENPKTETKGKSLEPVLILAYPRVTVIFSFCITIAPAILYSPETVLMGPQDVTRYMLKIIVMDLLLIGIVVVDFGLDWLQYRWR
ncbi:MAG: hypothetical protein ACE5OY_08620 [Candidatus Bathyarchaeia archaeon]